MLEPGPPKGIAITGGRRKGPIRGPPTARWTNAYCRFLSHQLSPVSVPAMTSRTILSVIASTSTDGILVLPDSRFQCISSIILWRKHNISMPGKLRTSLPPPPTSVCSHPSQRMIIHLIPAIESYTGGSFVGDHHGGSAASSCIEWIQVQCPETLYVALHVG